MNSEGGVFRSLVMMAILTIFASYSLAEEVSVPFDSERWIKPQSQIVEHLGRQALMGRAVLGDLELADGVIEVDIAVSGARSYPGLLFRYASDLHHENFYIRPHILGVFPSALQYTPVFNGSACWQLYSGDGYTAAGQVPENEWVTMRIELKGSQARVFLGENPQPALTIPQLQAGLDRGKIGVSGPADGSAHFSNFRYREDDTLTFEPIAAPRTAPGTITDWQVSQALAYRTVDLELHPSKQTLGEIQWTQAAVESTGLVNLTRQVPKQPRRPGLVFARTNLRAAEDTTMELQFGYSDVVAIFLRGELVFSGNSSYRSRSPIFQGIVGLNDALHLALKAGDNELLFTVAEGFGGWGLMARDGGAVFVSEKLEKIHESPEEFITPESVLYDKARDRYYVTNFDYFRTSASQHISTLSADFEIKEQKFVEGLARPLGMDFANDRLFVAEGRSLTEIDLEEGQIIKRHPVPGAIFLNDVARAPSGELFISDSARDTIWRFADGQFEPWIERGEIDDPNTLRVVGEELLVGNSADSTLKAFHLETKALRIVARFPKGILDGIRVDGNGNLLVAQWEGRLYRVFPDGRIECLLDAEDQLTNISDFEFLPDKKLLILPTFNGDRIVVYRLAD